MRVRKGFTLIEIIAVMLIIGILSAIAIPTCIQYIFNSKVQAIEHNLWSIASAEEKYYEDYGTYYTTGVYLNDYFDSLNSNLGLSMARQDDGMNYACWILGVNLRCGAYNGWGDYTKLGKYYLVYFMLSNNGTIRANDSRMYCTGGTCP